MFFKNNGPFCPMFLKKWLYSVNYKFCQSQWNELKKSKNIRYYNEFIFLICNNLVSPRPPVSTLLWNILHFRSNLATYQLFLLHMRWYSVWIFSSSFFCFQILQNKWNMPHIDSHCQMSHFQLYYTWFQKTYFIELFMTPIFNKNQDAFFGNKFIFFACLLGKI